VFTCPRGNVSFISIYLPFLLSCFFEIFFNFCKSFYTFSTYTYFILGFFFVYLFFNHCAVWLEILNFFCGSSEGKYLHAPFRIRLRRGTNASLPTLGSNKNNPERGTCLPVWQTHSNDGCHLRRHVPLRSFCHPRYRDTPTDCTSQFKVHVRPVV